MSDDKKTTSKELPVIHHFSVDKTTGKFVRVYANLVKLTDHELQVRIKDRDYIATSQYDLNELLMGNVLLAFVDGKKLYPLPPSNTFDKSHAEDIYKQISESEIREKVFNMSEYQNTARKLNQLKEGLTTKINMFQNSIAQQEQFIKSIPIKLNANKSGNSNNSVNCIASRHEGAALNVAKNHVKSEKKPIKLKKFSGRMKNSTKKNSKMVKEMFQ